MHAISLHLVLHIFKRTLIRWELNFNKNKTKQTLNSIKKKVCFVFFKKKSAIAHCLTLDQCCARQKGSKATITCFCWASTDLLLLTPLYCRRGCMADPDHGRKHRNMSVIEQGESANALFRFPNSPLNFTMKKENSSSHQNTRTYMEY
jgi:hypothetical protein